MDKKRCPVCGTAAAPDSVRCANCGWDYVGDVLDHPAAAKMPESEKEDFVRSLFKARAGYAMKFLDDSRTATTKEESKAESAVKEKQEVKAESAAKGQQENKIDPLPKKKTEDEAKPEKQVKPEVMEKTAKKKKRLCVWPALSVILTAVSIGLWSILNNFKFMYRIQQFNERGGQADIGTVLELPLSLILMPMMAAIFMEAAFDGGHSKNQGKWFAGKITAIVLEWLTIVTLVFWAGQQFAGMDWRPLASDIVYPASAAFERLLLGGETGTGLLAIPWACLLMYLPAALAVRYGRCYRKAVPWDETQERIWLPAPERKIGGLLLAAAVMFSILNNLNTYSYFLGMSNIVYYIELVIPLAVEVVIFSVRRKKGKDGRIAVYIGMAVGVFARLAVPAAFDWGFSTYEGILTGQVLPSLLMYKIMKEMEESRGWQKKLGTMAAVLAGVPALMTVLGIFGSAASNLSYIGNTYMFTVWMFYMIPAGAVALAVWRLREFQKHLAVFAVLFGLLIGICMMMIIFNTPFVDSYYYITYGQFGGRLAVEQCLMLSIGGGYIIYLAGRAGIKIFS